MTALVMKSFSHLGRMPIESEEHERLLTARNAELALKVIGGECQPFFDTVEHDAEILEDARTHLEKAVEFPLPVVVGADKLDSRWKLWTDSMRSKAKELSTCVEAIHFAQRGVPFDHREPRDIAKIKNYNSFVHCEFPWLRDFIKSFSDSQLSIPETLLHFDGRPVSNIFFWHLRSMLFCQTMIDAPRRILELGGGYGSLARLWLLNTKVNVERYVIADLPESLFFSEIFLRKEFGDQVGYWEGTDPGTRIVLAPIGRLHEYQASSDLVINIGSLQEMSDDWVTHYMKWLDSYATRYFYSLNYMGQPIALMYESRTFWAPRPNAGWSARVVNTDIPLVDLMCLGRNFVEILYEKAVSTRTLRDWSVLDGNFLTRQTYLEGLELLRQHFTIEYGIKFLTVVTAGLRGRMCFLPPKELLPIAQSLIATGDKRAIEFAKPLIPQLEQMIGNMST